MHRRRRRRERFTDERDNEAFFAFENLNEKPRTKFSCSELG